MSRQAPTSASRYVASLTQGLETDTPMLKVDGTVMKGVWDELFGSEIVLREGRCRG